MNTLSFLTVRDLLQKIKTKQLSSEEALQLSLDAFARYDDTIRSALEIFGTESIMQSSSSKGPLAGIPGIVKDNICQQGRITACASKILENFSSTYDATVVKKLKDAGALLVGRANCDEFAMGSSTETSAYGATKNPWDLTRVSGGSSGGSAAAVAAGFVPWALGTDTGGSVRQPAAFCGIVGLKPTYGRVSRYGLVAYGSSLDQAGIFTKTCYDAALILSLIAGYDRQDATSVACDVPCYAESLHEAFPDGLKIGVVQNALYADGMNADIVGAHEAAIKQLQRLGAVITPILLPIIDYSAAVYFIISRAEAASNLARFDGVRYGLRSSASTTLEQLYEETRYEGFGAEVRKRIMVGNYVLSAGHADAFYQQAGMVRQLITSEIMDAFRKVDLLLLPTHPIPAFTFGAFDCDKLAMDLQDYFTCPANLAGIPAISIPCGFTSNNLPIGMQLFGPHFSEQLLLHVGHCYEQETPWHTMQPSLRA
jgi:aspartyl-tRNA(Asn)/glutamyl-tRNA(Gln) amidotransferase subunit A